MNQDMKMQLSVTLILVFIWPILIWSAFVPPNELDILYYNPETAWIIQAMMIFIHIFFALVIFMCSCGFISERHKLKYGGV